MDNLLYITLLQPTWHLASVNKSFQLSNSGKPEGISSYNLGEQFEHKIAGPVKDLDHLKKVFHRAATRKVFRIYGKPKPENSKACNRNNENFEDSPSILFHLDIDGWKTPSGYSSLLREDWFQFLPELLKEADLELFTDVDALVLQTASAWNPDHINAHVYYFLTEPVSLERLREWSLAHNAIKGQKILDGAVYRRVQPDFISRRTCQGFDDPLQDSDRLFIVPGISSRVDTPHMLRCIEETIDSAGFSSSGKPAHNDFAIGHDWEETLQKCGGIQGINDPAYRAAAQLVQSIGTAKVRANVNEYVDRVYEVMWTAIRHHHPDPVADGARGGTKDIKNYDRTKIRGYLTTALNKSFGDKLDKDQNLIENTIQGILAGTVLPSTLFEPDHLAALGRVKSTHPGTWVDVRKSIKDKLKGIINITDLLKALKEEGGECVSDNDAINKVLSSFDWIQDPEGIKYCKIDRPTGYSLVRMDQGVKDVLFSRGLEVTGNQASVQFPTKALSVLVSTSFDSDTTYFKKKPVRRRVWPVRDTKNRSTWINAGIQPDQTHPILHIQSSPPYLSAHSSKNCDVVWYTDDSVAAIPLPSKQQLRDKFGLKNGTPPDILRGLLIEYLFENLPRFVACEQEDRLELFTWCVLSILDQSLSYVLQLSGPPQCGKSTAADFLQSLIDPLTHSVTESIQRHPLYNKKEQLIQVISSQYISIFDNLSNLKPQEQDFFCQVTTGHKHSFRMMYTQSFMDAVIKRPVILTTIEDLISRSDLRSRSINLNFNRERFNTDDIEGQWDVEKPYLFLGLCYLGGLLLERVKELGRGEATGLGRDFWIETARSVVDGLMNPEADAEELVLNRKQTHKQGLIESTMMHKSKGLLLAWLMNDPRFCEVAPGKRYAEYVSTYFQWYVEWAESQAGKILDVFGHKLVVSFFDGPKTSRAFGAFINQGIPEIRDITGWNLSGRHRTRYGVERIFYLTEDETSCNVNVTNGAKDHLLDDLL